MSCHAKGHDDWDVLWTCSETSCCVLYTSSRPRSWNPEAFCLQRLLARDASPFLGNARRPAAVKRKRKEHVDGSQPTQIFPLAKNL